MKALAPAVALLGVYFSVYFSYMYWGTDYAIATFMLAPIAVPFVAIFAYFKGYYPAAICLLFIFAVVCEEMRKEA